MRNRFIFSLIAGFTIFITTIVNPYIVFANNPPDQGNSTLTASNQAPANGSSTINVQITLKDSSGNPDAGDSVTFSSPNDSTVVFNPSSTTLNSSGQTSFTMTSTNAGTDNVTVTDTTSNTTLADLGQVTFTSSSTTPTETPTPTCAPVTTPQLTAATPNSSSQITLTWTDATGPVNNYVLAYGTSSGNYVYGSQNIGSQGTTSYTVSSLTQGTTYYFAIQAVNACSTSPFSNELSAVAGAATPTTSTNDDTTSVSPVSQSPSPQVSPSNAVSPSVESFGSPTPAPSGSSSVGKILFIIILIILLGVAGFFIYKKYLKKIIAERLNHRRHRRDDYDE